MEKYRAIISCNVDRKYISDENKLVLAYQIRWDSVVELVVHKNVVSICVHTEEVGNVENYGNCVFCILREGRDCDVCCTVFGEILSACILGERGWY